MAKKKRSNRGRPDKRNERQSEPSTADDLSDQPQADTEKQPVASAAKSAVISRSVKVVLSLVIVGHLLAVVMPPLAFQASGQLGGTSMVATLLRPVTAYAQALYLDRGYAFFAPDPGPSHLIQAAITQPSGEVVETLFPDRDVQWPRLKYHRHFMLSEFLTEIYQPPGPPAEISRIDPEAAREWGRLRLRYEHVRQSVVDHLRSVNNDAPVAIRRIEHVIPDHVEFQELGVDISDKRLYMIMQDLSLDAPPETVPAPDAAEELSAPEQSSDKRDESPTSETPTDPAPAGSAPADSAPADPAPADPAPADPAPTDQRVEKKSGDAVEESDEKSAISSQEDSSS